MGEAVKGEWALVADIGGTNVRFALADPVGGAIREVRKFRVADFETLAEAARAYLAATGARPKSACFAVAAPVGAIDAERGAGTDTEIALTNSRWKFRPAEIKRALGLDRFLPVNDFYALASSVHHLTADYFHPVKDGAGDPSAPTLVIGPGTGFGQALIAPFGDRWRVISTEGGHVSFAAQSDDEIAILNYIARDHHHVAVENVLSGGGIVAIYGALCALAGTPRPALPAEAITVAAIGGEDEIAVKTVNLFCAILGRVAGDAVLATGARGGVVLGGGILPIIREVFLNSAFIVRFVDKGRMANYVKATPVRMIVKDGAALVGAAAALNERGKLP